VPAASVSAYPPRPYRVTDLELLHRTIDAFPLATLVTAVDGEILVTHVPLILERSRGELGALVGHVDRNNPQSRVLDGASVVAVFHGPDTYISPTVYATSQLPTFNYVTVHVRGTAAVMATEDQLRDSLVRMADRLEEGTERFVLAETDPRVPPLLPHIVGFEIEIASIDGRFKLGQEKGEADRTRAGRRLLENTPPSVRGLVTEILDLG